MYPPGRFFRGTGPNAGCTMSDTERGIAALGINYNRVLKAARDTHPHPDTLGRLQPVLMGAMMHCLSDDADSLTRRMDDFLVKFSKFTRKMDDISARLQATRSPKGRRCGISPAAQLAGLYGDDLFRALMGVQLPVATPAEVCLEVALAAQRLIVHDQLDLFINLFEKTVFGANTTTIREYNIMAFKDHRKTLEKFVQEHIDLADAAATSHPPTGRAQ
ncbi:hypothetical protein CFC21_073053 [Triticum aestivum]|uniref:Uncharacterized protein n=2 Tax=Triticum aestivum TaxID=4565 RepID=A0A9R1KUT6_WHEAT|nr:uncharacterized protein LOC123112965 [Triticum aestivum]KAF7067136.1 hypothetical protein CFC21_073053 [Triticum aestivum]